MIFAHGGPASGFLWVIVMVVIAGQVAGRRGCGLRRLREDAEQARPAIEARLCLGLSARDAFLPHQRSALRTALLPTIDSTKVVGVIYLSGAMTGLILAGVDPPPPAQMSRTLLPSLGGVAGRRR